MFHSRLTMKILAFASTEELETDKAILEDQAQECQALEDKYEKLMWFFVERNSSAARHLMAEIMNLELWRRKEENPEKNGVN